MVLPETLTLRLTVMSLRPRPRQPTPYLTAAPTNKPVQKAAAGR
jgi:hypothetical protein